MRKLTAFFFNEQPHCCLCLPPGVHFRLARCDDPIKLSCVKCGEDLDTQHFTQPAALKPWQKLVLRFMQSPAFFLLFIAAAGALIGALLWCALWLFGATGNMGFGECVAINTVVWTGLTVMGHPATARKRED